MVNSAVFSNLIGSLLKTCDARTVIETAQIDKSTCMHALNGFL